MQTDVCVAVSWVSWHDLFTLEPAELSLPVTQTQLSNLCGSILLKSRQKHKHQHRPGVSLCLPSMNAAVWAQQPAYQSKAALRVVCGIVFQPPAMIGVWEQCLWNTHLTPLQTCVASVNRDCSQEMTGLQRAFQSAVTDKYSSSL